MTRDTRCSISAAETCGFSPLQLRRTAQGSEELDLPPLQSAERALRLLSPKQLDRARLGSQLASPGCRVRVAYRPGRALLRPGLPLKLLLLKPPLPFLLGLQGPLCLGGAPAVPGPPLPEAAAETRAAQSTEAREGAACGGRYAGRGGEPMGSERGGEAANRLRGPPRPTGAPRTRMQSARGAAGAGARGPGAAAGLRPPGHGPAAPQPRGVRLGPVLGSVLPAARAAALRVVRGLPGALPRPAQVRPAPRQGEPRLVPSAPCSGRAFPVPAASWAASSVPPCPGLNRRRAPCTGDVKPPVRRSKRTGETPRVALGRGALGVKRSTCPPKDATGASLLCPCDLSVRKCYLRALESGFACAVGVVFTGGSWPWLIRARKMLWGAFPGCSHHHAALVPLPRFWWWAAGTRS